MVRGLVIRSAVFVLGVVPLMTLLHAVEATPGIAWMAVIVYEGIGVCCLGQYLTKHADEIPTYENRQRARRS